MKIFIKKNFWAIIFLLYIVAVLTFIVVVYGSDLSIYSSSQLKFIIIQSLLVGFPPLFYPVYKYLKIK